MNSNSNGPPLPLTRKTTLPLPLPLPLAPLPSSNPNNSPGLDPFADSYANDGSLASLEFKDALDSLPSGGEGEGEENPFADSEISTPPTVPVAFMVRNERSGSIISPIPNSNSGIPIIGASSNGGGGGSSTHPSLVRRTPSLSKQPSVPSSLGTNPPPPPPNSRTSFISGRTSLTNSSSSSPTGGAGQRLSTIINTSSPFSSLPNPASLVSGGGTGLPSSLYRKDTPPRVLGLPFPLEGGTTSIIPPTPSLLLQNTSGSSGTSKGKPNLPPRPNPFIGGGGTVQGRMNPLPTALPPPPTTQSIPQPSSTTTNPLLQPLNQQSQPLHHGKSTSSLSPAMMPSVPLYHPPPPLRNSTTSLSSPAAAAAASLSTSKRILTVGGISGGSNSLLGSTSTINTWGGGGGGSVVSSIVPGEGEPGGAGRCLPYAIFEAGGVHLSGGGKRGSISFERKGNPAPPSPQDENPFAGGGDGPTPPTSLPPTTPTRSPSRSPKKPILSPPNPNNLLSSLFPVFNPLAVASTGFLIKSSLPHASKPPGPSLSLCGYYLVCAASTTGPGSGKIYNLRTGEVSLPLLPGLGGTDKPSCLAYILSPPSSSSSDDPLIWVGLDKGELLIISSTTGTLIQKTSTHSSSVTHILPSPNGLVTLDDVGGVRVWPLPFPAPAHKPLSLLRVSPKCTYALLTPSPSRTGHLLWMVTSASPKVIEVYNLGGDSSSSLLAGRLDTSTSLGGGGSPITSLTYNSIRKEVYTTHENGRLAIHSSISPFPRLGVVICSPYKITCSVVALNRIWIGLQTGKIMVFSISEAGVWICDLDFLAYSGTSSVTSLSVQEGGTALLGEGGAWLLNVVSCSEGGHIRAWDGFLRAYLMDLQVREASDLFSTYSSVSINMMTFNIDSRKPSDLESDPLLEDFITLSPEEPDIYVFGFQELVDLENKGINAKTFLLGSNNTAKAMDSTLDERKLLWLERIKRLFNSSYTIVECEQLVGLFTCLVTKSTFVLRETFVSHVKTGLGGLYGNKGAILVRFMIGDTSFCFVNSHLAAHQGHVSERNKDVAEILKEGVFPKVGGRGSYHWNRGGDGSLIMDHEHVFWGGDLNYRIDSTRQNVIDAISNNDWPFLWQNDQLLKQKEIKSFGLRSFQEGPLNFAPTFKYNRGNNQYDTSEKQRIPAYCDRILYHGSRIFQTRYGRHECKMSDHRPVSASFSAKVRKVDEAKLSKVEAEVSQRLSKVFDELVYEARLEFLSLYYGIEAVQAEELISSKGGTSYSQLFP